jgi:hypothetical protein
VDLELAFRLAHLPALAGWLALILAPRRAGAVTFARAAAVLIALFYLVLFLWAAEAAAPLAADYSLRGVGGFFSDTRLLLLGWVHYLAFDLWVGSWETEEAARIGMSRALLVPSLLLTLMLGPLGLLLFLALRAAHGRRLSRSENSTIAS